MDKKPGKPYILEERDGRMVRVYESGAVLDHASGSIIKPPAHTQITAATSTDMHRARQEQKQLAVMQAANAITQLEASAASVDPKVRAIIGNDGMSFMRGIAVGRQRAAMNSDNPYGNAAANWLAEHSGYTQQEQQPQRVEHVYSVDPATAQLLADIRAAQQGRVLDGELVQDADA